MRISSSVASFLLATLTLAGMVFAQRIPPGPPELPLVAIPRIVRGDAAVSALADRLPGVARHYGLTAERLSDLLRRDHDLNVDTRGRLLFAESYLPEPVVLPGPGDDQPALVPYSETFLLHSRPGATRKIFLDFDGHTTSGTSWVDVTDTNDTFVTPPYDFDGNSTLFSESEMSRIQHIWQRVAEDYSAFDVDVTTQDPGVEALRRMSVQDLEYGIRVCIGGASTDWYSTVGYGGIAYVGSFSWNSDTPCFVWSQNLANGYEKYVAEAVSHEVGHSLSLFHDGTGTQTYYSGHGTGADGWAPIMGVGYYQPVVQFSRGEYAGANNLEDDLAKITEPQNIPYISDDAGNDAAGATALAAGTIFHEGLIETTLDVDVFRIEAGAGAFAINVNVDSRSPNLNVEASIYDGAWNIIALSNPPESLAASFNLFGMVEGTYYLKVTAAGAGNPLNTGYSAYATIGTYSISGSVPVSNRPTAVATADPTTGVAPLTVQWSSAGSVDPNGGPLTFSWDLGNGSSSTDADPVALYTTPGDYSAVLTVTDDDGLSASATVQITVTEVPPAAPTDLVATAPSGTRVDLVWLDNASNESGYQIERSSDGIAFLQIATAAANATSYTDGTVSSGLTVHYRVRAVHATGNSEYSNTSSVTPPEDPPMAPTALSASAASGTWVNLVWTDNADNETGFKIERSSDGVNFTQVGTTGADDSTYGDSTVSPDSPYHYRVRATNAAGDSDYSNTSSVTTPAVPPMAPAALSASAASSTWVNLVWTDNADNETGFTIERSLDGVSFAQIGATGANVATYSDSTVSPGSQYHYRVRATNAAGDSGYSNTSSVTTPEDPPQAPTSLSASATSSTSVDLEWTDNANNETGFKIERSTDGVSFALIGTTGANVATYSDPTVSPGSQYHYRVRATNTAGDSGYANTASVATPEDPPLAPTFLTATAVGGTSIDLEWTDNANNETGFKIERSTDGLSFALIGTTGANVATYSDPTVSPGSQYHYRVRATNTSGDSDYSNTSSVITAQNPPLAPTSLSASAASGTQVNLVWTDNAMNETGFRIERSADGVSFAQIGATGANATSYADLTVAAGILYQYRIRAFNSGGDSGFSNTASIATPSITPVAPTGLTTTAMSATRVDLTWRDNSGNETGFKIERSTDGVSFTQIGTTRSNKMLYSDTKALAGITYAYRVRAYNSYGNSAYTSIAWVTTPLAPPLAPSNLAVKAFSSTQINLTWVDKSSNETGFRIERSPNKSVWTEVGTVGANTITFSSTGLTPNTTYYFRVRAYHASGTSAYSNTASTKTIP